MLPKSLPIVNGQLPMGKVMEAQLVCISNASTKEEDKGRIKKRKGKRYGYCCVKNHTSASSGTFGAEGIVGSLLDQAADFEVSSVRLPLGDFTGLDRTSKHGPERSDPLLTSARALENDCQTIYALLNSGRSEKIYTLFF